MNQFKHKIKITLLSLSLLTLIIFGLISTTVSASINYQTSLMKGTDIFTVNQYDYNRWKSTVNSGTNPSDWFEGNTNTTGAKSKVTIKGWNSIEWETYDVLLNFFLLPYYNIEEITGLLGILKILGYNETTINANYTNSYNLWYGLRSVWNFTITDFEDSPSYNDGVKVFRNPLEFKTMLDNYNDLATELNQIIDFQLAGYTFPILNADEFIWQLVFNGLAIAKPQSKYLADIVSELGCENVTVSGSTLTFNRHGESDYTAIVSYGEKGTISSFSVKDDNENIIFQIVSSNSEWIFYTILIIIAICCVVLVVYVIIKKRKPKL
ncbi:MAG: hypothetical protein ACFFDH_04220 [Promethearchaeota archaeon]